MGRWIAEADTWLSRSPGFFAGKPVVVDVSGLMLTKPKMLKLIADLNARDIRIMGIIGADSSITDPNLPPVLWQAPMEIRRPIFSAAVSRLS